ncbi:MAG: hypothetical protein AAAB35_19625 [Phyllobacterium sp.]|uniref:hypothetical protein n=1 Tax=Phyllobacterium sp. TaxID=1871046 RepID=UPI0030F365BE
MNAWLAPIVGETAAPIVGFVLLFLLVILLLLIVFAILRRATGGTFVAGGRNRHVRLSVTDAAAVDNRRRLVLVRRDDVEHLILIGGPSDVVIEQNIRQFAKQPSRNETTAPAASMPQAEPKLPVAAVEEPGPEPVAPVAAPEPAAPPVAAPAARPAAQVQETPQIPLRHAPPPPQRPVAPPRDLRLAEPPKHAPAAVPIPPRPAAAEVSRAAPVAGETPTFAAAPAAETLAVSAPVAENGVWPRVMRQASAPQRPAPQAEATAAPAGERTPEPRTTTAAAFPFAIRNEPASAAPTSSAYKEPTLENLGPAETEEPDLSLGELDFTEAFEADLESELHIAPGKEEAPKKPDNIEDEMERLLGELSKPEKR